MSLEWREDTFPAVLGLEVRVEYWVNYMGVYEFQSVEIVNTDNDTHIPCPVPETRFMGYSWGEMLSILLDHYAYLVDLMDLEEEDDYE